jgi:hypothetical protein
MDLMPAIIRIVLARQDDWRRVSAERWHRAAAYAAVLSCVPALATLAMVRSSDLPLSENAALVTYFASLVSVLALGAAFRLVGRMFGATVSWGAGLAVAAYGTTPIWIASLLLFSPILVMVTIISALHTLYLYYVGARLALGIRDDDAAIFVMLCVVAALVASTLAGGAVASLGLL